MYRTIRSGVCSGRSAVSARLTRCVASCLRNESWGEVSVPLKTHSNSSSATEREVSGCAISNGLVLCRTLMFGLSLPAPAEPGAPVRALRASGGTGPRAGAHGSDQTNATRSLSCDKALGMTPRASTTSDTRLLRRARYALWVAALLVLSTPAVGFAQVEDVSSTGVAVDDGGEPSTEDDDFDVEDIDLLDMEVPVVVTASRRPQRLNTVPYAMSVITAADIRESGAHSIPDALRLVPGVDVADLTFGTTAVSPRGFHGFIASQVLVLVDGRQIYDSLFGGTLWGNWPFQMEDIERIEVIRGPGGVTWGANAVNGVINIITKDPGDQLGLTIRSRGGSRGTLGQSVAFGYREGKLRVRVSAEYESSDGFNKGGSILRTLDDDYKGARLSLHAVYDHGPDDTITISAGSAVVDGGFPATPQAGIGVRRNPGSQASYVLGKWVHRTPSNGEMEFTGYVNDFYASPGIPQIDYRYQQIGLQFAHTMHSEDDHTRTWGVDTRIDLMDAGNSSPAMLSKDFVGTAIIGAYLQDEWRIAPKWVLSLGGRMDYEFYGGFQPSARASLAYELSETSSIYGAVSRAFSMPVAAGAFTSIPMANGLAGVNVDRPLDPTTLIAYELGYRRRFADRLDTSVSLFWHDYDEVGTFRPGLGGPGLLRFNFADRAGSVSLYGLELEAKYAATVRLTLLGNYTYQQMNWDVIGSIVDADLITPPKHKLMVGARYDMTDDIHLSANAFYVDSTRAPNPILPILSRPIDAYVRVDLRAEYEFLNDQAWFAIGVRNLLDPQHREGTTQFLNDAEVPRIVYAEFRIAVP